MHLLSRFGPKASSALLLIATQGVAQTIPPRNLDLESLGQVALAGDFDAISVYSYPGQSQGYSSNGTQSILAHLSSGAYQALSSTDASIEAMCPFVLKDGTYEGLVVGGNFTSIGGVNSRAVALFNTTSQSIVPLPGIQGTVSTLLCDQDTETVYVGGSFEAGHSSNAIAWIAAGAWANLPFAGFDAPVTSITKAPNGHIVFGGSFTGLGNVSTSTVTGRDTQVINLSTANVTCEANTTRAGPGDPMNVVCPSNSSISPWLLRDDTPGYWRADFGFGFEPTKLRLWNTNEEGRGTRTWRFTALPLGGIMRFNYTNPETGDDAQCDASCPLAQNSSKGYQDFTFVNTVGMNAFRIDISDWYGNGGGLDGVELFQTDIFSYAIDAFNEPSCGDASISTATTTGPWYTTPSRESVSDYLTVVVGPTTVDTTSIVMQPDVRESGNYSIIVYTPGCMQDSSCSARGIVNVTGTLTSDGSTTFSTQVFQTNNYDKFDQVYQGSVSATSSFRPSITITASGLTDDQLIVASRIKFGYISSTGGLNGLFDYDPNQAAVDTNFAKSAINNAGTMLQHNAHIYALATHDDTIYAAGQFSDDVFENIMAFSNNNATSLPSGGLNAAVLAMYSSNDFLYVAGNFTGTKNGSMTGLQNVAAYQYSKSAWVPLGAGVNGAVSSVEPLVVNVTAGGSETAIAFSGDFTKIEGSGPGGEVEVKGLAIWVPSQNSWLQNLDVPQQFLRGQLRSSAFIPNGTWLGAGTLSSQGQGISGAVGLQSTPSGETTLQKLPVTINPSSLENSLRKRALTGQQNITGVASGVYYNTGGRNVTVFGGHFSATATNGSTIENLMFLNGSRNDAVTGLPTGIDSNSTFLALAVQSDLLFAGGSVSGLVNGAQVDGLVVYDLQLATYRDVQPAALVGDNVVVNTITAKRGSTEVYVGGSFDSTTQDLACPCVCMYDTATSQWNTVGGGLTGTVTSLFWTSDSNLLAAGNLTVGVNSTTLAVFSIKDQMWAAIESSAVPGPITAFAPATSNADHMWLAGTASNGSTYLIETDDHIYRPVIGSFGFGTTIRGLQVMPLSKKHAKTDYLDDDQALLVTGQLNITNFGFASAAIFNGTSMTPFILASTSDGSAGSISQLFSSNTNNLKEPRRGRSKGIVVLVALCAALGTIFFIILVGIILNRIQRKRNGYNQIPNVPYADKNSNINRVPPERLFGRLGHQRGAPSV